MSNIADEPNFSDIIDFKNELFPYPKKVTRASFLKDLEINASDPSSSIQSLKEQHFDVDKFLNENYRFTLLEDLQTELNILLKELDKELFDLVNDDYFEFIKLGKALDGGEGLVDSLRVDVTKYNKKLIDEADRLEYSQKILKDSLENIESLRAFKKQVQNMLLLETFIEKLQALLHQNKTRVHIQVIKQITSLYITIHHLLVNLPNCQFIANKIESINLLKYEFRGVIDDYLRNLSLSTTPHSEITDILNICSVLGNQKNSIEILKELYNKKR